MWLLINAGIKVNPLLPINSAYFLHPAIAKDLQHYSVIFMMEAESFNQTSTLSNLGSHHIFVQNFGMSHIDFKQSENPLIFKTRTKLRQSNIAKTLKFEIPFIDQLVTDGLHLQRVGNAEIVSMSWRHHVGYAIMTSSWGLHGTVCRQTLIGVIPEVLHVEMVVVLRTWRLRSVMSGDRGRQFLCPITSGHAGQRGDETSLVQQEVGLHMTFALQV